MRLFLYEFITGGGLLADSAPPPQSLLREGGAMIAALAADALAIPDAEVAVLRDARLADLAFPDCEVHDVAEIQHERRLFRELATSADRTILIAPEFDGILLSRAESALAVGARLASPGPDLIALAADKHRAACHLQASGVPAPQGRLLAPGEPLPQDFEYPAVLKPIDGCGSLGVQWVESAGVVLSPSNQPQRLEPFYPGLPVSVAVLCGPAGITVLPPCRQHLQSGGSFAYLGGSLPLLDTLAERAMLLAARAAATLPKPVGYIGFDLVLGDDPLGSGDVVIEINPRLTTSYIGLRAALDVNLASAMLAAAAGEQVSLPPVARSIQFDSGGNAHAV